MEKLNISDISSGDWLSINGNEVKVIGTNELHNSVCYFEEELQDIVEADISAFSPIPIYHEALLKNDFVSEVTWHGIVTLTYSVKKDKDIDYENMKFSTDITVSVEMSEKEDHVRHIKIDAFNKHGIFNSKRVKAGEPHYIHELQHAMRDAHIEKQIEL